ncbi:MAG: hypothetical protein M1609_12220 [Firmicutes bacterium]|nr:hypothetical protein [Bacillota bacterium]
MYSLRKLFKRILYKPADSDINDNGYASNEHGENEIAQKTIDSNSQYAGILFKGIGNLKNIRLNSITNKNKNTFNIDVSVVYGDLSREYRKKFSIISTNRGWRIAPQSLQPLLNRETPDPSNSIIFL